MPGGWAGVSAEEFRNGQAPERQFTKGKDLPVRVGDEHGSKEISGALDPH